MNSIKDMKILIIGANFINKGAQSMLFVSVNEVKKRFPSAQIYFATFEDDINFKCFTFRTIYYNSQAVQIALNPEKKNGIILKTKMKNILKYLAGKKYRQYILPTQKFLDLTEEIQSFSMIIDISGFCLGDKWGIKKSEQYLDNIRMARKYNIPIFLMPQSFGPFNYKGALKRKINDDIKNLMKYATLIFARESEGYHLLTKDYGLTNVKKSYDLVLQNKGICLENVFRTIPDMHIPHLPTKENIAIVPNIQCLRHGEKLQTMNLYQRVIRKAIKNGNYIYLICHASEDRNICLEIKNLFKTENCVIILEQDFSCLEYDILVRQFKYIVCSRFHGIVHAYRNSVPCIILGWAIKYKELAKSVNQEEYCFDITKLDENKINEILCSLADMDKNYENQSKIITECLADVQANNCFDELAIKKE